MDRFVTLFSPVYPKALVYMLQSVEYQPGPYLRWWRRTSDFSRVMYRRQLEPTRAAKLLLWALRLGMLLQFVIGASCVWLGIRHAQPALNLLGVILVASYPVVWAYLAMLPLWLGRVLLVNPKNRRLVRQSKTIFTAHPGVKIAVAGSYGKTSMKELLKTVLSEGKDVAATPANKNVAVSHAFFAQKLTGREDVLIIEYGEGAPGDVERFVATTQPNWGIITGLAPAHLDHYPNLQAAGEDIFELAKFVGPKNIYVNGQSPAIKPFLQPGYNIYDSHQILGWTISHIKVGFDGTSFTMQKENKNFRLHSGLLGEHQVGPLALVAALADRLGLTKQQIVTGIGKTQAFEHRMQARPLHGAWIIDDTYNGNIDGLEAGLRLLKNLPGKRKIYVTPGLVDQGVENEAVHVRLGKAIAAAAPDQVVLMQNSATTFIKQGMEAAGYKGDVRIETQPLEYYANLEHRVAAGDVFLLQNDWTDNYN